jgi:hypothetical protein
MRLLGAQRGLRTVLFFLSVTCSTLWSADIKPEEVLTKHLNAIGSAEARKSIKSRAVQGMATYHVLVGGSGAIDGKLQFASEGSKSNYLFRVNGSEYHGEQFIFDGSKMSVAGTWADKTRSEFGNLVLTQDIFVRDNLLCGVWSTDWPLLDLEGHKARLHVEGIKKIDGKDLLAVRYQPKKSTDLEIVLYFDPKTYQHVATIYKMEPPSSIGGGELQQAGKQRRRIRVDERFSNFRTADGLTLPYYYDLRFTIETERGFTKTVEWEVKELSIANNMSIDPRSFQVK